jgi:hypothetical protein
MSYKNFINNLETLNVCIHNLIKRYFAQIFLLFTAGLDMLRSLFDEGEFVNTTPEVFEQRDVKGLYKKARKGKIPNLLALITPSSRLGCQTLPFTQIVTNFQI